VTQASLNHLCATIPGISLILWRFIQDDAVSQTTIGSAKIGEKRVAIVGLHLSPIE